MESETDPPAFLTTKEVAALLRVKERKVYDLAAAGDIPFRRVTGKLLFPRAEIDAWIAGEADPRVAAASAAVVSPRRPNIVVGSHDPLLEWALRASNAGLASLFDGSLDGLDRIAAGEAAACALHVLEGHPAKGRPAGGELAGPNHPLRRPSDPTGPEDALEGAAAPGDPAARAWNVATVSSRLTEDAFVLVEFARRRQGVIARPGPEAPQRIADLAGRRIAARQPQAGSRILLDRLLAEAGLGAGDVTLIEPVARTEAEAAEAVAAGEADAALGLEAAARRAQLAFTPLIEERFDLLLDRRAAFDPPLQTLLAFCRSDGFRARAEALGGYDVSRHGQVVWNGV